AEEQLGLQGLVAVAVGVLHVDGGVAPDDAPVGEGPAQLRLLLVDLAALAGAATRRVVGAVPVLLGAQVEVELEAVADAELELVLGANALGELVGADLVGGERGAQVPPVLELGGAGRTHVDAGGGPAPPRRPAWLLVGPDELVLVGRLLAF